jgi:hypothetical protein
MILPLKISDITNKRDQYSIDKLTVSLQVKPSLKNKYHSNDSIVR